MTWAGTAPHSYDVWTSGWTWRVMVSVWPVTSSAPVTTAWSMVFRTAGPGRHWAAVGPGTSHHIHAGLQGLLLISGPGRPVGRLCLRSLRRAGWLRSLLRLGQPVIPMFGWRGLYSFFWSMEFNGVVHFLRLSRPRCHCRLALVFLLGSFLYRFPRLRQPILAHVTRSLCAKRQSFVQTALLATVVCIAPSPIVRAPGELQLQFRGRGPVTWLRHLVNKARLPTKTEWSRFLVKSDVENVHTWERLASGVTATN